jgi:hypothetical protein
MDTLLFDIHADVLGSWGRQLLIGTFMVIVNTMLLPLTTATQKSAHNKSSFNPSGTSTNNRPKPA